MPIARIGSISGLMLCLIYTLALDLSLDQFLDIFWIWMVFFFFVGGLGYEVYFEVVKMIWVWPDPTEEYTDRFQREIDPEDYSWFYENDESEVSAPVKKTKNKPQRGPRYNSLDH